MILSSILAGKFSRNVQSRGREYFCGGHVRITSGSAFNVMAQVSGKVLYSVELNYEEGTLEGLCDCPYFATNGGVGCKHIWATILAAEQQGYLGSASSSSLKFVAGGPYEDAKYEVPPATYAWAGVRGQPVPRPQAATPPIPRWQQQLASIRTMQPASPQPSDSWNAEKRELFYVIDPAASERSTGLVLALRVRDRTTKGWGRIKPISLACNQISQLPPADREIISSLLGGKQYYGYGYFDSSDRVPQIFLVSTTLLRVLMPLLVGTGRLYCQSTDSTGDIMSLSWDDSGTWQFVLELVQCEGGNLRLQGTFRREQERMELGDVLLVGHGVVVATGKIAPLLDDVRPEWISQLRRTGYIEAPQEEQEKFVSALLNAPGLPPLKLPEELRYETVTGDPQVRLRVVKPPERYYSDRLSAELSFGYEGHIIEELDPREGIYDAAARRFLRRDREAERRAAARLDELDVKRHSMGYAMAAERGLPATRLPRVVRALTEAGWHIEAEGKLFRPAGEFRLSVSSGVDWFELHGEAQYGESTAQLPELLTALLRGENVVRLGDGSYGLLPEDWLHRIGGIANAGTPDGNCLKFRRSQVGLLDALLAAQPETSCDETFARVRQELRDFRNIEAAEQPAGFVGELRGYQREGLGWLHFLRRFSFGGCLADDMGVGKTAQVLALLETRRQMRAENPSMPPSLVVVPKSLIFNWKQEAARFTPQLRVLDHTGLNRDGHNLAAYDLILTTYGTLRRDALFLKDVEFDYVVLDEAQAVKNSATASSKAVRILRAANRLALSGTPVENHLGELWTLFEFLNPGMLGAARAFRDARGIMRDPDDETRALLARALRPFILRRTKEQVARELPAKTEQTVYCEMERPQRKLYDELRQHYRASLRNRIEREGIAKSKIQVLEALLRLRQAACHPGLLDPKRCGDPSAKLELLLEQLDEVIEEDHKALIFSQFTSLLQIVRDRLDEKGIVYEYLDGATRNRQARVERFQADPKCKLFLISLKAGGLGLNLTAADYIFILDPWWNPAAEAQAIDRAHRIGQTRQVFAYRLIARDTIEEKVLQLQDSKRDLAAAIIGSENSLMRNLRAEDIEVLLS